MASDRVNARLPKHLADHVARVVGPHGLYETPSEYIRSLIRRDMEETDIYHTRESIREGYRDLAEERYFPSSGNFLKDRKIFQKKENQNWD